MPKIVLIRHAHSTANAAGILSGQLAGVHLSKSGQVQAERLAERLGKLTIAQIQVSPMDARSLKALVPTFADSDIYICGPEPLVSAVRKAAEDLGVPKNRFHDEAFAFHSE